jgi:hypothetical protein
MYRDVLLPLKYSIISTSIYYLSLHYVVCYFNSFLFIGLLYFVIVSNYSFSDLFTRQFLLKKFSRMNIVKLIKFNARQKQNYYFDRCILYRSNRGIVMIDQYRGNVYCPLRFQRRSLIFVLVWRLFCGLKNKGEKNIILNDTVKMSVCIQYKYQ